MSSILRANHTLLNFRDYLYEDSHFTDILIKAILKLIEDGSNALSCKSKPRKVTNIGSTVNISGKKLDLRFDVGHTHSDMSICSDGKSVKRIKNGTPDVPIYATQCISSGVAEWKVKVVKGSGTIGLGISSNNTGTSCYNEYFEFSSGTNYGMSNEMTFKAGDELFCKLDMEAKQFVIKSPTSTSTCKVAKNAYYPCFEIYNAEDEIMLTSL